MQRAARGGDTCVSGVSLALAGLRDKAPIFEIFDVSRQTVGTLHLPRDPTTIFVFPHFLTFFHVYSEFNNVHHKLVQC